MTELSEHVLNYVYFFFFFCKSQSQIKLCCAFYHLIHGKYIHFPIKENQIFSHTSRMLSETV